MGYRFLEDVTLADIAFEATGRDLPELFQAASEATLKAMVENPEAVESREERQIQVCGQELDLLLYQLLQELVFFKDAEQLMLRVEAVQLQSGENGYVLTARARGEKLDPRRHELGADVKAVTLHKFTLEKTDAGWTARVILDV